MTTETQLSDMEMEHDQFEAQYEPEDAPFEAYRSFSKAAVISLVAMLLGLTSLLLPAMLVLPLVAVIAGLVSQRNLRTYPEELTGRKTAWLGTVGGLMLLVGGSIWHVYVYATEVPDGYARISFSQLQTEGDPRVVGPQALPTELDGQRVFVKGYVHPGVSDMGEIRRFVLVPDMGTCCFGGQPKMTDMIEVRIVGKHGLRYSQLKRRLAGTFHVALKVKQVAGGLTGGYYELEADYVK